MSFLSPSPYPSRLTPYVVPGVDLIKNALLWCLASFPLFFQKRRNLWRHNWSTAKRWHCRSEKDS